MKRIQWLLILLIVSACAGIPDFMQPKADDNQEDKPNIDYKKGEVDTLPDVALKQKKNFYYGERTR